MFFNYVCSFFDLFVIFFFELFFLLFLKCVFLLFVVSFLHFSGFSFVFFWDMLASIFACFLIDKRKTPMDENHTMNSFDAS